MGVKIDFVINKEIGIGPRTGAKITALRRMFVEGLLDITKSNHWKCHLTNAGGEHNADFGIYLDLAKLSTMGCDSVDYQKLLLLVTLHRALLCGDTENWIQLTLSRKQRELLSEEFRSHLGILDLKLEQRPSGPTQTGPMVDCISFKTFYRPESGVIVMFEKTYAGAR
jgi:hypothetical protein